MIRYILLAICCSYAGASDPCNPTVYKELDPEGRWVSNVIQDVAQAKCDRNLEAAWYRVVDGPAGSDMPTVCPGSFSCGTVMPVWINGALPLTPGDEVSVPACQRSLVQCCGTSFPMRIKNCGNYNVYFLDGSHLTCDAVFCFEMNAPCPPDESSDTGYQPGCSKDFPAVSGPASVELYTEWTPTPSLYFRCSLGTTLDTSLLYDVDWFYNEENVHSPRSVIGSEFHLLNMSDAEWHSDTRKMGFDVLTPTVTVKERESAQIRFQMTAPFPCDPDHSNTQCAMKVGALERKTDGSCAGDQDYVRVQDCKVPVYRDDWNEIHNFQIKSKTDMKQVSWDIQNFLVLETEPSFGDIHKTWLDYRLPPVKITIENNERHDTQAHCFSSSDPQVFTFDRGWYNVQATGEFLLYKNTKKPVEVHAVFSSCGRGVSCNCAVAVRAGLDLFAINRCNGHLNQGEIECGGLGHLKIIRHPDGRTVQVRLPTGGMLTAYDSSLGILNIGLHIGLNELGSTAGLCGTFDRDFTNDLPEIESKGYFRVSAKDSFFQPAEKLPIWDDSRAGQCKCNNKTMECDWSETVATRLECLPPGFKDMSCHTRSKRDVMQEDYHGFDFDGFEPVLESDHNPDLSWKGNWTEAKAKDFCQNYVQQFEVVRRCAADVGIETNSSVDMCVMDIQLSGSSAWAQNALDKVKSLCVAELEFDSKYWAPDNNSDPSPPLKDQIETIMCPEECNFRGTCVNGSCQCPAGYRGVSCGVDMSKGPDVIHIPRRGLCDIREKPCRMTAVLGDNFLDSANLTCRLSSFLVRETGVEEVGEVHQVPGVFESYAEVLCPAHSPRERRDTPSTMTSTGAHGYMISVANDGALFGTPLPFVIFDSRCLDCQKSPDSITCNIKPDRCFIEGACYTPGEGPYDKTCVECRPAHSQRQWSVKAGTCLVEGNCFEDGAKNPRDPCYLCDSAFSLTVWKTNDECTDRKLWIIGAVLGSLLLLLVAVLLIWKFKVNRKQKVGDSMQDFSTVRASTKTALSPPASTVFIPRP